MHCNPAWTDSIYVDLSFLPKENDPDDDVEWPTLSIRLADHEANGDILALTRKSYDFDCTTLSAFKRLKKYIRSNARRKAFRAILKFEWKGQRIQLSKRTAKNGAAAREILKLEKLPELAFGPIWLMLDWAALGRFASKREFLSELEKKINEYKKK
jgi:hypothetical protein